MTTKLYTRSYVLSVIEQKVSYTREERPVTIKQEFISSWKDEVPVDGNLTGSGGSVPVFSTRDVNQFEVVEGDTLAPPIDGSLAGSGETIPETRQLFTTQQTKTTSGGRSVAINKLHIEADITSSDKEGEVSNSTIRIYNASKDTRAKLERKNAYVILEAGYEGDIGIVFTGTVAKAYSRKVGNNVITELLCLDSNVQLKTSRVSFSWPPNTSYSVIMQDVAKQLQKQGISTGVIITDEAKLPTLPNPSKTVAKGGYTFQGLASQLLDKLCDQFGYTWNINLNELSLYPKFYNGFTTQYDLPLDIIKSIRPETDSSDDTPNIEKPAEFLLETFLDHRIRIGQLVRIIDGNFKGTYKVREVRTSLSLEGGSWDSLLKLEATS